MGITVLRDLPRDVMSLVNAGVYSLYTLFGQEVPYVLVTNRGEIYFISATGKVVLQSAPKNLSELQLGEAVFFRDFSDSGTPIKVNFA